MGKDYPVTIHAVSGYSGAGKKAIAQYEDQNRDIQLESPRLYALTQQHKHLKEMVALTGINLSPAFCPIVGDFYSGMPAIVRITRFSR